MELIPLFDRVLLLPVKEQVRDSGIHIPQAGTEKSHLMRVVRIGSACGKEVNIGDTVIVHKYACIEVMVDAERFLMVKIHDIMGVVRY